MRKKTHLKMLLLGIMGGLLTFRREIHEFTRIELDDKEEEAFLSQLQEWRVKHNMGAAQTTRADSIQ